METQTYYTGMLGRWWQGAKSIILVEDLTDLGGYTLLKRPKPEAPDVITSVPLWCGAEDDRGPRYGETAREWRDGMVEFLIENGETPEQAKVSARRCLGLTGPLVSYNLSEV